MSSHRNDVTSRKRLTVQQRQQLLARYHRSPLAQAEFTAQHGIGLSTLGKWLREARAEDTAPSPVRFQEMVLPSPAPRWTVEVVNPQGWTVRL